MKKCAKLLLAVLVIAVLTAVMSAHAYAAEEPATTIKLTDYASAEAALEAALLAAAESDVILDLEEQTWTVDSDGNIGSPDSIPANTVTITNGTVTVKSTLETISGTNMAYVLYTKVMYGNFVFDDITLGAVTSSGKQISEYGGFVFPEGCSGVFGHEETDGTFGGITSVNTPVNLFGNVTTYSGTYALITGGICTTKGTRTIGAVVNDPVIVVGGDTVVKSRVAGGGVKNYREIFVTGSADVTIKDNASVEADVAVGSIFTTDETTGGTLLIDTTGSIGCVIAGEVGSLISSKLAQTYVTTVKSGTIASLYGFKIANNYENDTIYGDITINIEGGTFTGTVYGGALINTTGNKIFKCNTTLNISGGSFSKTIYGGSHFTALGDHAGSSKVYLNKVTLGNVNSVTNHVFGGSQVSYTGAVHSGTSELEINGGVHYDGYYGGSCLDANDAKHTGVSKVIVKGNAEFKVHNQYVGIYGGSDIQGGKTGRVHSGDSFVTIGEGSDAPILYTGVYGGSFITLIGKHEAKSTVTINNAVIRNGASNIYIFGGSSLGNSTNSTKDNLDMVHKGDSSVVINDARCYPYADDYYAYIFGGSEMVWGKATHIGNSSVTVNGGNLYYTTGNQDYLNGVFGGSNLCDNAVHQGDSELNINGGTIKAEVILGGSYGAGKIVGDSAFTMTAGTATVIPKEGTVTAPDYYPIGAGSYGTNTLASDEISTKYGLNAGIRQTGDLTFKVTGGTINAWVQVTGYNSHLDGNVTVYLNGGTISYITVLGRGASASITGDLVTYYGGSVIRYRYRGGTTGSIVGGNVYTELTSSIKTTEFSPGYYIAKVSGSVRVKLIGDIAISAAFQVDPANKKDCALDLLHYTGTQTFVAGNATAANKVDKIIKAPTTTIAMPLKSVEIDPGTELKTLIPENVTWDGTTYSYAELTAFDGFTEYDNAVVFADADTKETVTKLPTYTSSLAMTLAGHAVENVAIKNGFRISAAALALHHDLSIVLKVEGRVFDENGLGYSDPYIKVMLNGKEETVQAVVDADGKYTFTVENIAPHMMGDELSAVLYAVGESDVYSQTLTYSVKKYCDNMLANSTDDKLKTLLVDLLNYGAAAQEYVGYKTDTLVNAGVTGGSTTLNLDKYAEDSNSEFETVENASVYLKGASLVLDDSVTIRFNMSMETGTDLSKLKVEIYNTDETVKRVIGGAALTEYVPAEPVDGMSYYYVDFDGFNAAQMGEKVYIKVVGADGNAVSNTAQYSIGAYAYAKASDEASDAKLVALVKAMIKYGVSAEQIA